MPEQPLPNPVDVAVTIIVVGALVIGLISMFAGRVMEWWYEGIERAEERRRVRHSRNNIPSSGGSTNARPGADTGAKSVVPAQQHQAEPELVLDFDRVLAFLSEHNLTDEQAIAIYSVVHRGPDDYPLSANKIRDAVGGNEAAVKAQVADRRPRKAQPAKPSARLERPANGW